MARFLQILVLLAGCSMVPGATLERLSLEEMSASSTSIVRARATAASAVMVGSTIYTRTRFQVLERWKGPEESWVDVYQPGGSLGPVSQSYSGVPRFSSGQELVLFLWTGPSGRTQVMGLSQGVFEVVRSSAGDPEARRLPLREVILEPGSGRPAAEETAAMPLGALAWRVRIALQTGGRR